MNNGEGIAVKIGSMSGPGAGRMSRRKLEEKLKAALGRELDPRRPGAGEIAVILQKEVKRNAVAL